MKIAHIALPINLFRLFDYQISNDLADKVVVRGRVEVPFGRRTLIGIVVTIDSSSELPINKLKIINRVIDDEPIFSDDLWSLLCWTSSYYQYPLGETLLNALPILLRQGRTKDQQVKQQWQITTKGNNTHSDELGRAQKQKYLFQLFKQYQTQDQIEQHIDKEAISNFSKSMFNALSDKELIERVDISIESSDWMEQFSLVPNPIQINDEQINAIMQINAAEHFNVFLLDGVTGSGKTEVYLNAIESTLSQHKQVLVMVPEIGLTPQTIMRFKARLNVPIEVLHSNLTDNARLQVWQRMNTNQSAIVIGTRSAIYTPFHQLGLIIIDEEHDLSYKQQDGFRYHARDTAIMRAKFNDVPIVLGSATPSFETIRNTEMGRYQKLVLTKRAGNAMPIKQHILDIKGLPLYSGLSNPLLDQIKVHIDKQNQVLLFLNRRGFAAALMCHDCGWSAMCPRCDKPFTYHQKIERLVCHHCDARKIIPKQCPDCGSTHLIPISFGTEQIEQELKTRYPTIPISRIDRDSTSKKGGLDEILKEIHQGKPHILIGTQMLAKGHHFPDVTLVGVIDVDGALFSADFRATEHFAQLYTQVSGRAGREQKQGHVILQTHHPEHPLLQSLIHHGYGFFAEQALDERRIAQLPPFTYHVMIRAADKKNHHANLFLTRVRDELKQTFGTDSALWMAGPMSALFAKKADYYYSILMIQHDNRHKLNQMLSAIMPVISQWDEAKKVKWLVDVDPMQS